MYIYIIQMHSQTLPARLVRSITKYQYSHVGICLNIQCDTIYTFGRRSLNNFFNGGFIVEKRTGKFFKKFTQTICRIYQLEISEQQYTKIKEKLNYMVENRNLYKYDFVGIFLRLFKIPIYFKNHYVCSQFVAELLEECNVYKFKMKTCFVKPIDFEKITGIKEIYSGKYLSYTKYVSRRSRY